VACLEALLEQAMSTARVFDVAEYMDDLAELRTAEVPVTRPTEVLSRIGQHGAWERVIAPVQTHAGPVAKAGVRAWWEIAKEARTGAQFVGQRVGPVLTDAEGRAEVNAYTRKIKNRKAAAKDLEDGSDEQLRVINQEQKARSERRTARIAHNIKVAGANSPLVAAVVAGHHYWPSLPIAADALIATAATCGGVTALGLAGRRVKGGEALFRRARTRSINDELLREVLTNLGIQPLAQKINEVKPVTLTVDNKTHFSTTLRLPMRVTANAVLLKHEEFAGNLDVNPDCLILERGESASRLVIKVSKLDPAKRKQGRWEPPKAVDIFGPLVVGENAIGEPVSNDIESALLAIGASGSGKSMALQLLIATAALDPLVRLRIAAFASSGDFAHLLPLSEQSTVGDATDRAVAERGAWIIEDLNRQCGVRGDILLELNEPKVTRELAEQHAELRPIVCVFDEIQVLLANNKRAKGELLTLLSKCRKFGIRPIVSTPRIDKTVIDTSFVGAFTRHLVFKTAKEWESREMLGGTSEAEGFKPFYFSRKGEAVAQDPEGRTKLRVYPVDGKQQRASLERTGNTRGSSDEGATEAGQAEPGATGSCRPVTGTFWVSTGTFWVSTGTFWV
jgi:hypothetical protein